MVAPIASIQHNKAADCFLGWLILSFSKMNIFAVSFILSLGRSGSAFVIRPNFTITSTPMPGQCIEIPEILKSGPCTIWNQTFKTDLFGDEIKSGSDNPRQLIFFNALKRQNCDVDSPNIGRFICSLFTPNCQKLVDEDDETKEMIEIIPPCRNLCQEFNRETKECTVNEPFDIDCNEFPKPLDVNKRCVSALFTEY